MISTSPHSRVSATARGGFSLVELMVVMAIMALLISLAVPAVQGTLSAFTLKGAGNSVVAQLDLARQIAASRNISVEVRFYQDTSQARDSNGNYPYNRLTIVIPRAVSGAASDEFLTLPLHLAGNVIIDSNPQYSSVLNTALGSANLQPVTATELATAPLAVRNLPYTKITFLAKGTINLDPGQQWFLTLIDSTKSRLASAGNGPGSDFITLVLDVLTAHVRVYQP